MEKTKLTVPYIIRNWNSLKIKQKRAILSVLIVGVAAVLFLVALIVGIASCAGKTPEAEPTAEAVLPIPALLRAPEAAVNPAAEPDRTEPVDANADLPAIEDGEDESTDGEPGDGDAAEPDSADNAADEPESTYQSLKKHDRGEDVTVLQSRLMELGYLEIEETTDYFGSSTEYALVLFQRQHDLKQDGVAGAETLALLYGNDAQPYVLKEGAEGRDVKMLQEQLVELGYLSSDEVDRIYGSVTIDAVQEFQKRNGLSADGKAGEKTLEKLYSDEAKISKSLEAKIRAEEKAEKEREKKEKEKGKSSSSATAAPKKETRIEKFIKAAKSKIGCEYILGDSGPNTFDCSGFVTYCLRQAGVSTLRLNAAGFSKKSGWKTVSSIGDLQKGDILFFRSDSSDRVSHCGIYIGSGTMIDASSSNGKVVKRSVSQYWKRNFVNAKRPWG